MVTRVTNQAQQNTALRNIFRITEDLFKTNEQVATGKRINSPSDDPSGLRDAFSLRTSIQRDQQFNRNINNNRLFVQGADSALDSVGLGLIRARELSLQSLSGTDTPETRQFAAIEIGNIIEQTFQSANTEIKNQYLFGGTHVKSRPFVQDPSGASYQGNSERFSIEIAKNQNLPLTRPGGDVFVADLNPAVSLSVDLADLNQGQGVPAGTFQITDRSGNSSAISVLAGETLGDVVTSINASGLDVTAQINSKKNGLVLIDNSTTFVQSLSVSELAGGKTASALGMLGKQDGDLTGRNLRPVVTASTLISDLNGSKGLNLDSIDIVNGVASGTVTLSSATTLGDVISIINASSLNVTASVNTRGNALTVDSNDPNTVAIIQNSTGSTSADDLGVGGGNNIFMSLAKLKQAMEKNDSFGIIASLDVLENALSHVNDIRADMGSSLRLLDQTEIIHSQEVVDKTNQISEIEDTDIIKAASDIAQLEFALNATLNTSSRILQPSLLDFLR